MAEGLTLMVVGMTTVFGFLVLLVVAMRLQAALFQRYDIEFVPGRSPAPSASRAADPHLHIAIALAAIESRRRRQSP